LNCRGLARRELARIKLVRSELVRSELAHSELALSELVRFDPGWDAFILIEVADGFGLKSELLLAGTCSSVHLHFLELFEQVVGFFP